jgi:ComF family protein
MQSGVKTCGACLSHPPAWDNAVTGLLYEYPVDHLVRRFKFHRNFACGQLLADELVFTLRRLDLPLPDMRLPDLLLPVPLHFTRRFQRGYNQAEFLARSVGKALCLPVRVDLLHRTRRTTAQSGLDRAERRKNVRGAFSCHNLAGARVALVDDVLTTGTTLEACARAARNAGASQVSIWVAARVPSP